jgi:radical SAM protein with 4Fe4S-binding SPASM domain
MKKTNDFIRGNGVFKKVINSIMLLKKVDLKVGVTLVLSKINKKEIIPLINICDDLKVDLFILKRLLPLGRAESLSNLLLEPQELKKVYQEVSSKNKLLRKKKSNLHISFSCDGGVFSQENKHFSDDKCMLLADGHLTILANGDVYPCRRLPIKLGNALKDELINIFLFNKKLNYIRNLNNASETCRKCFHFETCLSGAKCISYAWFKKLNYPDPQCWQIFDKLPLRGLNLKESSPLGLRVYPNFLINSLKIVKGSSNRDKIKDYSYKINLKNKIERNYKIPYATINEEIFLITPMGGLLRLNKTASLIWELCSSKISVAEILKYTSERFNAANGKLQKDIFFILKRFAREYLIEILKD